MNRIELNRPNPIEPIRWIENRAIRSMRARKLLAGVALGAGIYFAVASNDHGTAGHVALPVALAAGTIAAYERRSMQKGIDARLTAYNDKVNAHLKLLNGGDITEFILKSEILPRQDEQTDDKIFKAVLLAGTAAAEPWAAAGVYGSTGFNIIEQISLGITTSVGAIVFSVGSDRRINTAAQEAIGYVNITDDVLVSQLHIN